MRLDQLRRAYLTVAIIWLNSCVLFLAICAAIGVPFLVLDRVRAGQSDYLSNSRAVHSLSDADARSVFRDFQCINPTPVLRPWVGFSEPPWHSKWVNIDAADPIPIRRTPSPHGPGPFSHDAVIWLFGGSTAMGYGLPDGLTLSAQIQDELQKRFPTVRVSVINHAHLGHFSSQEIVLFQWLLRSGKRANVAVFLDGINDAGYELDKPDIDYRGNVSAATQPLVTFSPRFPPVRLFRAIRRKMLHERAGNPIPEGNELPLRIAEVERRYLSNVRFARASGDAFGVETLFVWQPTPFDAIDTNAKDPEIRRIHRFLEFEPAMKPLNARFRSGINERNFVFLADIFAGDRFVDTYLDAAHYGDSATKKLAAAIAGRIVLR